MFAHRLVNNSWFYGLTRHKRWWIYEASQQDRLRSYQSGLEIEITRKNLEVAGISVISSFSLSSKFVNGRGKKRKPSRENERNIINYLYCIVMMQPLTKILQCINKELDFCNELQNIIWFKNFDVLKKKFARCTTEAKG